MTRVPILHKVDLSSEELFVNNGESFALSILKIFLAAEFATKNDQAAPWLTNCDLMKRRSVMNFDNHLQQMLFYVDRIANYSAFCIECGNKSFYRTELRTEDGYCLHFHHSFNPLAHYNKKYLTYNETASPKYGYFQYELNKTKERIKSLKLIIPSSDINSLPLREIDCSSQLMELRQRLLSNKDINPTQIIESIKKKYEIVSEN